MYKILKETMTEVEIDALLEECPECVTHEGLILGLIDNEVATLTPDFFKTVYEYGRCRLDTDGTLHVNYKGVDVMVTTTPEIMSLI